MAPSAHESLVREPVRAPNSPALQPAERLSIADARDLLDWLQARGVRAEEVKLEPDGTLTVRWAG